jgi:hypothetical protein
VTAREPSDTTRHQRTFTPPAPSDEHPSALPPLRGWHGTSTGRRIVNFSSRLVSVSAVALLFGCGSDDPPPPADVDGTYSVTVTNGPAACPLDGWTEGAVTPGVPMIVTQNDDTVSADVGGAGAVFLGLWCGSAHFTGTVYGSDVALALNGTRSLSSGSCAFTVDAHVSLTASGNTLSGSITYATNTNSSPDCALIRTCTSRMNLTGTRPASGN